MLLRLLNQWVIVPVRYNRNTFTTSRRRKSATSCSRPLCCKDQQPGAVNPPQRHLREANVLRPAKLDHPAPGFAPFPIFSPPQVLTSEYSFDRVDLQRVVFCLTTDDAIERQRQLVARSRRSSWSSCRCWDSIRLISEDPRKNRTLLCCFPGWPKQLSPFTAKRHIRERISVILCWRYGIASALGSEPRARQRSSDSPNDPYNKRSRLYRRTNSSIRISATSDTGILSYSG
jgi:hypothetical protein